MATSHGSPLFPQPRASAPAAIPVPDVASSYFSVSSPPQGPGHPTQGGFTRNDLFLSTFTGPPG